MTQHIELPIEGMTCQHCVRSVQTALEGVPGVRSAAVDLDGKKATVELESDKVNREKLVEAVVQSGYRVPDETHAPPLVQVGLSRPFQPVAAPPDKPESPLVQISPIRSDPSAALATARAPSKPVSPSAGQPNVTNGERMVLDIEGMHCASCVSRVEGALQRIPGVSSARVNLAMEQAAVEFDPQLAKLDDLLAAVRASGYGGRPVAGKTAAADLGAKHRREA